MDESTEGFDLKSVGASPSPVAKKALLDKDATVEFKFGDRSWSLRVSATDPGRRRKQQRAMVQFAENVPFDKLSPEDAFRVRCLASVATHVDDLPKELWDAVQSWDAVLAELYFLVEDHSDKYFRSVFGSGEGEERAGD